MQLVLCPLFGIKLYMFRTPFASIIRSPINCSSSHWFTVYKIIYRYLRQYTTILLNTTLFYTWRHVSAAHTAIFRPAYNRTGPFMCAPYGIPHCLHIKYMWNKYICKTYIYICRCLSLNIPRFSLLIKSKINIGFTDIFISHVLYM